MRPSLPSPASRILAAVAAAIGGAAVVGVEQSHGSTVYHGPGTGTAHQLQPGLAVIATPGSISPLDRSAPANLVINGDFTDNGRGNTTSYRWSPRSTNSLSGVQLVSVPTATSPPTTSIPGWTFTGGGSKILDDAGSPALVTIYISACSRRHMTLGKFMVFAELIEIFCNVHIAIWIYYFIFIL